MAKESMIQRDVKREKMAKKYAKREALLAVARDRNAKPEEIFQANMKLAKLPKTRCQTVSVIVVLNRSSTWISR